MNTIYLNIINIYCIVLYLECISQPHLQLVTEERIDALEDWDETTLITQVNVKVAKPEAHTANHAEVIAPIAVKVADVNRVVGIRVLDVISVFRRAVNMVFKLRLVFAHEIITGKAADMNIYSHFVVEQEFVANINRRKLGIESIESWVCALEWES